MQRGRGIRWTVLILCILGIAGTCSRSDNPAISRANIARRAQGPIAIGAASPWGQHRNLLWQGLELAKDEINQAGGLLGRPIELIPADDDATLEKGQLGAFRLAENPDVVAVIGHSNSYISIPTSLIYQYYGILMLSPLSTSKSLTQQGFDLVFRNIPTDDIFGREAARFCSKRGYHSVMIYYVSNAYGESLANAFELECRGLGIQIVDRASYDSFSGIRDYESTIRYWQENFQYDAIFLAGLVPQAAEFVKTLREIGVQKPIVGGDGLDHPMVLQIAGKAAEGVFAVTIFDPQKDYAPLQDFLARFRQRYGKEADQAALQGYDALEVLAEGIRRARSTVPERIADGLRSIDPWNGPAGPYRFNQQGDVVDKQVTIRVVHNGAYTRVSE